MRTRVSKIRLSENGLDIKTWKEILQNTFNFEKEFLLSLGMKDNRTFEEYLSELYNEVDSYLEELDKYVRTYNYNKHKLSEAIERDKSTPRKIFNKKSR